MRFGPVRRVFMIIVLGAFLCVGFGQLMPSADAAPGDMAGMSMAMDMGDGGAVPMPCKGTGPNYYSSMGCIFMMALPPACTPIATQLVWSRVVYRAPSQALQGFGSASGWKSFCPSLV